METNSQDNIVQDLYSPEIPTVSRLTAPGSVSTADVADDRLREHSLSFQSAPVMLPLDLLVPHPQNPRLVRRDDVIASIRAGLAGGFDPAHALIVRPHGERYQILSGHNRMDAALLAGLTEVPCWVREHDDEAAYMVLVKSNAQGELSRLEQGMHALNSGMDIKAYAKSVGRKRTTVQDEVSAAEVARGVLDIRHDLLQHFSQLVAIHTARSWLWPTLASAMLGKGWTVGKTREVVARLKDLPADAPEWVNVGFCTGLVAGTVAQDDPRRIEDRSARVAVELQEIERQRALAAGDDLPKDDFGEAARDAQMLADAVSFASFTDALNYFNSMIDAARRRLTDRLAEIGQAQAKEQRETDQARQRSARHYENVSLEEWQTLDDPTRAALLPPDPALVSASHFNKQENAETEWAMWSWNPITGCEHTCPYCSARELATSQKKAKDYPYGFAPTLRPSSLLAPRNMQVPLGGVSDPRARNVITGSRADIFGPWVPFEWIEAVLAEIRNASNWNFLCLTKFPERMGKFEILPNMWMGTTVDFQERVAAAEAAFTNIGSTVKWLSCEPLLEPLQFRHMGRFDWIVIGAARANTLGGTPEWCPPFEWIADLFKQARDAGVKVYFTRNLLGNRIEELPFDAPIAADPIEAPPVFHYLNRK
jgi:ParB/RepB/Spo0J family partition protein